MRKLAFLIEVLLFQQLCPPVAVGNGIKKKNLETVQLIFLEIECELQ